MIGKMAGSILFVRGGVTARPRTDLQHGIARRRLCARSRRYAGVCAAQADGEKQAENVLQVIKFDHRIEDMLACPLAHICCCGYAHGNCC